MMKVPRATPRATAGHPRELILRLPGPHLPNQLGILSGALQLSWCYLVGGMVNA